MEIIKNNISPTPVNNKFYWIKNDANKLFEAIKTWQITPSKENKE
jgi:hypothetical protein